MHLCLNTYCLWLILVVFCVFILDILIGRMLKLCKAALIMKGHFTKVIPVAQGFSLIAAVENSFFSITLQIGKKKRSQF